MKNRRFWEFAFWLQLIAIIILLAAAAFSVLPNRTYPPGLTQELVAVVVLLWSLRHTRRRLRVYTRSDL